MPIYEYQCQACGHQFETTQRITESPLKDCPSCTKPALERLISSTAFLLKGGGWYKDGYGGSSNTKPRTENQVGDRLNKALADDKKKTEAAAGDAAAAAAPAAATPAAAPTSGGGSASSGASSGGSSGGSSSGSSSSAT